MKEQRTIIQLVSEVHALQKGLKRVIVYRLRLASFPGRLTPASISVLQATNAGGEGLEARLSLDLLQANMQLMSPFSEYRWIFCVFDSSFYGDCMQSCTKTVSCMC